MLQLYPTNHQLSQDASVPGGVPGDKNAKKSKTIDDIKTFPCHTLPSSRIKYITFFVKRDSFYSRNSEEYYSLQSCDGENIDRTCIDRSGEREQPREYVIRTAVEASLGESC